jgi:hypothetical protein
MSTLIGTIQQEINDLKRLRKWLIMLFIIFAVIPIPVCGVIFYEVEKRNNCVVKSPLDGIAFCFEAATGADVTGITPVTNLGKVVVSIVALMDLVFFGFITAIITCSVEIYIKQKSLPRLRTMKG